MAERRHSTGHVRCAWWWGGEVVGWRGGEVCFFGATVVQ